MSATKEHYHDQMEAGQRNVGKEIPILFSTPMVQAILEGRKTMTRRIVKCYTGSETHPNTQTANWQFENKSCPYGQPGDVLWVRESFCKLSKWYGYKSLEKSPSQIKWKPSIHMPKAAARIWLQVEEIRVERLLYITEEDAIAEGCYSRNWFEGLWGKINGDESWEINPWVWVVKFKILSTTGR